MGTYGIIGLENRDGSVSLWCLNTTAGNVLPIFSDEGDLAEVMTYVVLRFTAASPAQVKPKVEELRQAAGAVSMNFVTEGEEIFGDLLVQIRKQNASNG